MLKRISELTEYEQSKDTQEEFCGLDHNLRTKTGYWYDMKNMCTDNYPVASVRRLRGEKNIFYDTPLDNASDIDKVPMAMAALDNKLITLNSIKDLTGQYIGAWLFNNGKPVGNVQYGKSTSFSVLNTVIKTEFGVVENGVFMPVSADDFKIVNHSIEYNSDTLYSAVLGGIEYYMRFQRNPYGSNNNITFRDSAEIGTGYDDNGEITGWFYYATQEEKDAKGDTDENNTVLPDNIHVRISFPDFTGDLTQAINMGDKLRFHCEELSGNNFWQYGCLSFGDFQYLHNKKSSGENSYANVYQGLLSSYDYVIATAVTENSIEFKGIVNPRAFYDELHGVNGSDFLNGVGDFDSAAYKRQKLDLFEIYIEPSDDNNSIEYDDKMKYFAYPNDGQHLMEKDRINGVKRSLVRIGSYLSVFPDAVVYESNYKQNDTKYIVPMFHIGINQELSGFEHKKKKCVFAYTLDFAKQPYLFEPSWNSIANKYNFDLYRISGGATQKYIADSKMWCDCETLVTLVFPRCIIPSSSYEELKLLKSGDWITLYTTDCSDSPYGVFNNKKQNTTNDWEGSVQIEELFEFSFDDKGESDLTGADDYYIEAVGECIIITFFGFLQNNGRCYKGFENIKVERKCPEITFACESQNRVWGCVKGGHEICASKQGNPYNFYSFAGISQDSYEATIPSNGEFTACCNYLGTPVFFKENTCHMITGSYPEEYNTVTYDEFNGVESGSEKSLAVINNILYYKSPCGIVAFDGSGQTSVISTELGKEKYKNAVAGAYDGKYYVSMENEQGVYELFVYNTSNGLWSKEDQTEILQACLLDNSLLLNNGTAIVDLKTGAESRQRLDWFVETGVYGYSYPNNKYLSRFQIRMKLDEGSTADLFIQYDDGIWEHKGSITGKGLSCHLFPIIPHRCDHAKVKICGHGYAEIYSITKILEQGGDV